MVARAVALGAAAVGVASGCVAGGVAAPCAAVAVPRSVVRRRLGVARTGVAGAVLPIPLAVVALRALGVTRAAPIGHRAGAVWTILAVSTARATAGRLSPVPGARLDPESVSLEPVGARAAAGRIAVIAGRDRVALAPGLSAVPRDKSAGAGCERAGGKQHRPGLEQAGSRRPARDRLADPLGSRREK